MTDPVNEKNREARREYEKIMRANKPHKEDYPKGGYDKAIKEWQHSYSVGKVWMNKVNDASNKAVRQ